MALNGPAPMDLDALTFCKGKGKQGKDGKGKQQKSGIAPGTDGKVLENVTCHGCKERKHVRAKCPEKTRSQHAAPSASSRGRLQARVSHPKSRAACVSGRRFVQSH